MPRLKKSYFTAVAIISLTALLVLHASLVRAGGDGDVHVSGGVHAVMPERPVQTPVATQGMRVYRDPQTGQLGPPPSGVVPHGLTTSEQHMLSRSDQGLQQRTLQSGGVAIDLQGRFRNMAVATVGAGGQAAVNCALTPAQAAAALKASQQSATGSAD
ncbi:MAG: hypothetical protein ABFS22_12885 [Pseudomonadota bacterium]